MTFLLVPFAIITVLLLGLLCFYVSEDDPQFASCSFEDLFDEFFDGLVVSGRPEVNKLILMIGSGWPLGLSMTSPPQATGSF